MSSQWMPFALYGLRRYFDTGRLRALAGGTAAFVVQGLSSGYYLFYFAPVLLALRPVGDGGARPLARRGALGRRWRRSGAVSLLCTLPFLLPYAQGQGGFGLTRPYRRDAELLGGPVRLREHAAAAVRVGERC